MGGNQNYNQLSGIHRQGHQEKSGAASDVGSEIGEAKRYLLQPGFTVEATIKTYLAGLQSYIVYSPALGGDKPAIALVPSLSLLGARSLSTLSPGQPVMVWVPHGEVSVALIIGALPWQDKEDYASRGTLLVEGAGVGIGYDQAHRKPAGIDNSDPDNPPLIPVPLLDFNSGRPWDTLSGDAGVINDLGVGYLALRAMALLTAGGAEVSVSYLDQAVRLVGDRITVESLTTESRHFNDQGEGSTIRQFTPYLWEGMGFTSANSGEDVYNEQLDVELTPGKEDKEQLSVYAPYTWDQIGIFRCLELEGYLGGLKHMWAVLPRDAQAPVKRSDDRNWPGLAEVQTDVDGFMSFRSAKGMLFQMTNCIVVPEEKREPWDPKGDSGTDCDWGGQALPAEQADYQWVSDDPAARAGAISDYAAYRTGVTGLQGVFNHPKDWKIPSFDESQVAQKSAPEVTALGSKFSTGALPFELVDIDHLRKGVKFTLGKSTLLFGDDGSIFFSDAAESSIFLTGTGNIEISSRGDTIIRPGRSLIVMAPRDVILNAGHNAEMTAAKGDFRIKAENAGYILTGNGEDGGGLLIENRTNDPDGSQNDYSEQGDKTVSSGIVFKSPTAPVVTWGSEVFVQSQGGKIVLDGDGGSQDVTVTGKNVAIVGHTSTTLSVDTGPRTGDSPASEADALRLTKGSTALAAGGLRMTLGGLGVNITGASGKSSMLLDGSLFVTGNTMSVAGYQGPTEKISMVSAGQMQPIITPELVRSTVNASRTIFATAFAEITALYFTDVQGWGNPEWLKQVSFSFNTSDGYWTADGFMLHATPWQVLYAAAGVGDTWEQPPVKFQDAAPTCPWPGFEAWVGPSYGEIKAEEFNNFDPISGLPKALPRATVVGPKVTPQPLQGHYPVDSQL